MAAWNGWQITRAGVVFVIGIVVLAGLVFAGVWFVNERGEQARRDEAIKVAEAQLEEQSQTNSGVIADENGENEQTDSPVASDQPSTSELPATGSGANMIALGLLAGAATYFVLSRRTARDL